MAIVLSVVIVMLGLLAIVTLPISQFPPIAPPLVQVGATYIGASASVVEQSVATAIEKHGRVDVLVNNVGGAAVRERRHPSG